MDAVTGALIMQRFAAAIHAHDWERLGELLHDDFRCRLVHTGEIFDRESWLRFNADYPGFGTLSLEDWVASGNRVAARSHVTGTVDGIVQHFEVAGFATVRDGLIVELTEVWTDVGVTAPPGTRPD